MTHAANHRPALTPGARVRGVSLVEALIALALIAFGLLAMVGLTIKLARSEDVARQRGEAARLAQERIEVMRGYTQIDTSATTLAWADLASGNDAITNTADYSTNATFARTWTLLGTAADPMRRLRVNVSWVDRADETQNVSLVTVISKTDPSDVGSLGFPLPDNTTLKRPKNRNLNIPVPALDLGNGQSVAQMGSIAVVFSNETGYVVMKCTGTITSAAQLTDPTYACSAAPAYIIAGYISLHDTGTFPAGLNINTAQLTGATAVTCSLGAAVDQSTGSTISGYKYYMCVITVATAGAPWSGTLRLGGSGLNAGTNYLVCRFQYPAAAGVSANMRNVQPYVSVAESIDNQNYVITDENSCPTVSSLASVLHQNCRSSNPNGNPNRATDCPP